MKKLSITILTAFAAAAAFAPTAQAATISVNFDGIDVSSPALAPGDSYGAILVPNWNNVSSAGPQTIAAGSLMDSTGSFAGESATIALAYDGGSDSYNHNTGLGLMLSDNIRMGSNTLSITGIVGPYDLLVYVEDWGTGGETLSVTVNGTNKLGANNNIPQNDVYVENSNYLKFTGLTGTATVSIADNRQFPGFQIETIPEPATMSLLAIGGIALLRRKRK